MAARTGLMVVGREKVLAIEGVDTRLKIVLGLPSTSRADTPREEHTRQKDLGDRDFVRSFVCWETASWTGVCWL